LAKRTCTLRERCHMDSDEHERGPQRRDHRSHRRGIRLRRDLIQLSIAAMILAVIFLTVLVLLIGALFLR
jgi:hypothetical protein